MTAVTVLPALVLDCLAAGRVVRLRWTRFEVFIHDYLLRVCALAVRQHCQGIFIFVFPELG